MEKIKIIVDSGHSIEKDLADKYDIGTIPFKIHFGDKSYTDQKDISTDEFFKKLKETDQKVTTSIPSLGEFSEELKKYIDKGYNRILCFAIAPKLSGMYNMMNLGKNEMENDKVKIEVINTKTASLPLYFIATNSAKRAKNGEDFDTIHKKALEEVKKANIYARAKSLDYLVKGGRLPKPIAKFANLVSFLPIFTLKDGEIKIEKKAIGQRKSFKELVKLTKEKCKKDYILAIGGGDSKKEIDEFKEAIKDEIENAKIFKQFQIPPVFGVHLGPGSILVSVLDYEDFA